MTSDRNAWIQERAYHLWLEAGRPHGTDQEHWYRAERELIKAEGGLGEQGTGIGEDIPAATSRGGETIGMPDASAADAVRSAAEGRRNHADIGPAVPARSRAKSPAATPSNAKPRAARSRPAASGSGSRGSRRSAAAKPAE
jgi:hypothetical protein